ncbi:hypothetical protein SEPCBS119000_005298 [Sporothrix epigloea]|uniref:Uncharacterized protein n=1 Tax=Sporothrix epigloea TaxID=1892477 RepID=A0ABP0DX47_9PEZI
MNYANMIEEKHLKKGFIIATLISTVIGTFTTGINLYERVRERHDQKRTDRGQNEKIKDLERRADAADKARLKAEKEKSQLECKSKNGNNGNGGQADNAFLPYKYAPLPYNRPQNDLRDALAASGPMIRREYDRDYARLGSLFAQGDTIAQNELQAQIIDLQASVIRLLQDALESGSLPDPAALYAAAGRARNGSIRALQDQYQRMLTAAPRLNEPGIGYGDERSRRRLRASSVASGSTRASGRDRGTAVDFGRDRDRDRARDQRSHSQLGGGSGRRSAIYPLEPPSLFCRYAVDLQQDTQRPLVEDGGGSRGRGRDRDRGGDDCGTLICPACMGQFSMDDNHSWKMQKPVVVGERIEEFVDRDERPGSDIAGQDEVGGPDQGKLVTTRRRNVIELVQDRRFVVSNRFIVKCHRPAIYDIGSGNGPGGGGGSERGHLLPPTYACYLCDRFESIGSGKVTLCGSMARLVSHLCEQHTVAELLSDPDISEIRPPRRQ